MPARGGCERHIVDLIRRFCHDGHRVHLYAHEWDAEALPAAVHYHRIAMPGGPRFSRPWRFSKALAEALPAGGHDITLGFDKVFGVDVQYPAGGLYHATVRHGLNKYRSPWLRR